MRHLIFPLAALVIGLAGLGGAVPAAAQDTSVLKVARGLASNNISVLINRAVVIESTQPFTEVSVAQPEIADVSPLSDRSIYIFGRSRGVTSLTLLGENGQLITNVTISVMPDLSELKARLKVLLPKEKIDVRTAGGGLVLSGTVTGKSALDRAMRLARAYAGDAVANMMTVGGSQQVSIKVRVAEMSRTASKAVGVSLGFEGSTANIAPRAQTGSTEVPDFGTGGSFGDSAEIVTEATGFGTFGALFAIANSFILDVQLDLLESKGFARSLAEPTLVTLSGSEANFLAGGEVPVPVVEDDSVEITFRPVGVNLIFRPTVLDDDLINVSLSAEVSAIDEANSVTFTTGLGAGTFPGFSVQRASTNVQMRDGQSFAIAGLYTEDFGDTVDQVPWLGDLPILGTLFRSSSFQKDESELVIFVTVHLVSPVDSEDQLALPTDRIALPNEAELFLMGHTVDEENGTQVIAPDLLGQGFEGDFGYVVE